MERNHCMDNELDIKKCSENPNRDNLPTDSPSPADEDASVRSILGLGDRSARKSYYPALQDTVKELEEEKGRYERIFANALSGIFQATPEGKILVANPAMARICGYTSPEEFCLKSNIALELFSDPNELSELLKKLKKQPSIIDYETEFKRRDGSKIDVSLNSSWVESANETYLECFVQDITGRKQAERELHQLRNYLANIINSMPSVLIGIDPEGRVTQWNLLAQRETGIPVSDAIGQSISQVFPALSLDLKQVRTAIDTGKEQIELKRSFPHGDKIRYRDITIYPLIANGSEGAVIRLDDVTEQVQMEEMMIQSEKMLSVGGLAAGMAHEINNPLAGMMQTANVVLARLSSKKMPANLRAAENHDTDMDTLHAYMNERDILHLVEGITTTGQRVAKIVENMLSFARKGETESALHDLNELLEKTLNLAAADFDLKKQYDFKTFNIVKEYAVKPLMAPCDGGKIQQVLLNILRNGAQAMQEAERESPSFTLRTYRTLDDGMACIEIEDNGPGMDEKTRKRIFEPFFTTKPVGVGTGLGLSVSYFIITDNHHGKMSVESELGKGTQFCIQLPL